MGVITKVDTLEFYPQDLHLSIWENSSECKGVIAALHGLESHGQSCFHYFGPYMAERGWTTIAIDMPGLGHWIPQKNKAEKQHWNMGFAAIAALLSFSRMYCPGKKVVLLGSSLGALFCLDYVLQKNGKGNLPDTVILSVPPLDVPVPFYVYPLVGVLSVFAPNLKIRLDRFAKKEKSHDPESIVHQKDPFNLTKVSVGFALKVYMATRKLSIRNNPMKRWPKDIPVFFQTAGQDTVVDSEAIKQFYHALPNELTKQHQHYENAYHYLFHEDIRETMCDNIDRFLSECLEIV